MGGRLVRASVTLLGLGAVAGVCLQAASTLSPAAQPSRALIDRYCLTCHNARLKRGNLVLEDRSFEHVAADAEVWEKVLRKLRTGTMPPAGMPRPDPGAVTEFVARLEATLDGAAAAASNPARPGIHRLNRAEYTNAIRDLLGLEIDGRALLPADDAGYGFDNIAGALSVSPGLLERYLNAAHKISRMAIGDPTLRPTAATYTVPFSLLQEERTSDDLPFGSRGGIAVRHHFPLDGEYIVQIRLQRRSLALGGGIRGLAEENQIDVRLDGERVQTFTLGGGEAEGKASAAPYSETDLERFADDPLNVRFPAKAGTRVVGVALLRNMWMHEGVGVARLPLRGYGFRSARKSEVESGKIEMGIDRIEITGPFNGTVPDDTPSRRRIFVCRPAGGADEEPCAKTILSTLARRAYRRPVTDGDIETLLAQYREGRSQGNFDAGIRWALKRVLVGPDFLFRIERDPANAAGGTAFRLTDVELASRLSFFLWSSIPDDELLEVAVRGKLNDPAVLERQVRRMLEDARSAALVSGFFSQWLWLRNVETAAPDPREFPASDENLRRAFQRETQLFLESQLREDRSIVELLTANYTFVNERLAKHYGISNIYGNHFRRVPLPDDRRAGLLGQGSILMATSYANRTSPVQRGKWLLQNILGVQPPEPPPNVPPFPENDGTSGPKTVRARLEEHRKNPVCAACHAQMDPLGFALENFDAIGQWRTMDESTPIDPSGVLPNGAEFVGPAAFRARLLEQQDVFVGAVAEKLLTYALGRGVEYYDMPAVRRLVRETEAADYRWSALVLGIAKSGPFQMRRSP